MVAPTLRSLLQKIAAEHGGYAAIETDEFEATYDQRLVERAQTEGLLLLQTAAFGDDYVNLILTRKGLHEIGLRQDPSLWAWLVRLLTSYRRQSA